MGVCLRVGVVPGATADPSPTGMAFLETAPEAAAGAHAPSLAAVVLARQVAGVVPVARPLASPPLAVGRKEGAVLASKVEAGAAATARRAAVRLDATLVQWPLGAIATPRGLASEVRPAQLIATGLVPGPLPREATAAPAPGPPAPLDAVAVPVDPGRMVPTAVTPTPYVPRRTRHGFAPVIATLPAT